MSVNRLAFLLFAGSALAATFLVVSDPSTTRAQPGCVDVIINGTQQICISLLPETATNNVGTTHTVTATVTADGAPVEAELVDITVISGPNTGQSVTDVTDANGELSGTYTGNGGPGIDVISACIFDSQANDCADFGAAAPLFVEDQATKEWLQLPPSPPSPTAAPTAAPTATASPPPRTATPAAVPAAVPGTGGEQAAGSASTWWAPATGIGLSLAVLGSLAWVLLRRRRPSG